MVSWRQEMDKAKVSRFLEHGTFALAPRKRRDHCDLLSCSKCSPHASLRSRGVVVLAKTRVGHARMNLYSVPLLSTADGVTVASVRRINGTLFVWMDFKFGQLLRESSLLSSRSLTLQSHRPQTSRRVLLSVTGVTTRGLPCFVRSLHSMEATWQRIGSTYWIWLME